MAAVSVAGDDLVVEVTGFDRFCAFNKRGVTVPLEHVVAVGEGVQMGRPLMPGLPCTTVRVCDLPGYRMGHVGVAWSCAW